MTDQINKQPVDTWIIDPMKRFMSNSTTSGIILFSSALLALILANHIILVAYSQVLHTQF
jgi:NhaA family Na+:H+ antiporter